jgi:hypothetical protein
MGNGNDPTTIPAVTGGGHVVLIIVLGLLGFLTISIGVRIFMRSLFKPGQTGKAVGGGVCAVGTLSFSLLAFLAGSTMGGVLLLLATVGFVSYTIPQVRASIGRLASDALASARGKSPTKPPDRVSHV